MDAQVQNLALALGQLAVWLKREILNSFDPLQLPNPISCQAQVYLE